MLTILCPLRTTPSSVVAVAAAAARRGGWLKPGPLTAPSAPCCWQHTRPWRPSWRLSWPSFLHGWPARAMPGRPPQHLPHLSPHASKWIIYLKWPRLEQVVAVKTELREVIHTNMSQLTHWVTAMKNGASLMVLQFYF